MGLDSWQSDCQQWTHVGDVALDAKNPVALKVEPGEGVLVSTLAGRAEFRNFRSIESFGDIEAYVDFLLPKGGNAGLKLQGLYEMQIRDSIEKKNPAGDDCGGIYPRARTNPPYHLIDKDFPPRSNVTKAAGLWQTFHFLFQAPRFDSSGEKTANARLLKVVLNDVIVHKNVELKWPTGHGWRAATEAAEGHFYLQGDHGPVAYRNVRVRPLVLDQE